MHRLASCFAVCLLAMTAATIGTAAGARLDPAAETHAQEIARKAGKMGVGANVKVSLSDGRKLTGTLIAIGNDDLRLFVSEGDSKGEQAIRYADIASLKQKGSRTALWIALGVAIGILIPIGICAASA